MNCTLTSETRAYTDLSSALADKWTVLDKFLQFWRYRRVVGFIPVNCVLADLGCGRGDFLRYMQSRIAVGYGIDTKIAAGAGGANLHFKEADLNNSIPLKDKSVDVVTSLAVLEHLNNPAAFVKELFRILKSGGICIITTPATQVKTAARVSCIPTKNYFGAGYQGS